jgi:parvulin-like peptidyl-prolyl isomerase
MLKRPVQGLLLVAVLGLAACSTEDLPLVGKPAASFDGGSIKMADYKLRLKVLQENYRKQTQAQGEVRFPSLDGPAGRKNETILETEAVQDLVDAALIERQAQQRGLSVTEDDINKSVDPFRTNYNTLAAQQTQAGQPTLSFNDYLNSLGFSLDQLRQQVRSRIFEQRLEDKMALQREAAALAMLKQGTDIGTVAKKYSDDTSSSGSGGGLTLKTADIANVPQLKPTIDGLQPGQSSSDFVRVDDGYYYFKMTSRDATSTKMQYVIVYDPKPALYTAAKRAKWFVDAITGWEQQAHVKYNVGSRAT